MSTTKKETQNSENINSLGQITLETLEIEEEPKNYGFSALNGKIRGLEKKHKLMQEEITKLQEKLFVLNAKMEIVIKSLRR